MLNKENILGIIANYQKEIEKLEKGLVEFPNVYTASAIHQRLSFLRDNLYKYEMQARAWKLID